jgi:Methyltransferase domain
MGSPENDGMSERPAAWRLVRDDPEHPDPEFSDLYASLPDAIDLEPWLSWCRQAEPPVLYLGVGAGRLAVPLARAGVELVAVDAHPGMLSHLRLRQPKIEVFEALIENLDLGRRFDLVIGPSNVLYTVDRLRGAARHSSRRVAFELLNPHWLAAGAAPGVQVHSMDRASAEIEVDYPGGWRQQAEVPLVWPEEVEAVLEDSGLQLQLMRAAGPETDLAAGSTFFVLARVRSPVRRGPGRRSPSGRTPRC